MSGKFALIIGNTEYIDPGLAQLTAPGKDAQEFARILKDQNICGFDDVKVLLNQLSPSVIEAIDEFFDQRKPDDLLLLYFSGHGVKDDIGSLYLAFKNTIRSRLRSTAIKSDYIREAMDQSRSKRQVLILDCCNSGAFPQGAKAEVGGAMGLMLAFQGYGRYVLTASDATQFAWEGDKVIGETENSLFTHFLMKGLEGDADNDGDGRITVDELYDYAYGQISRVTPKQTPTKSASKQEGEIVLRQITRIEDIKPVSLPDELIEATQDSRTFVREGAVQQLAKYLNGKNLGLARSARDMLEKIAAEDDSHRVRQAAAQALELIRQAEQKVKEEQREAEQFAKQAAQEKPLVAENVGAKRLATQEYSVSERTGADREIEKKAQRFPVQVPGTDSKLSFRKTTLIGISVIAVVLLCTVVWVAFSVISAMPPTTVSPGISSISIPAFSANEDVHIYFSPDQPVPGRKFESKLYFKLNALGIVSYLPIGQINYTSASGDGQIYFDFKNPGVIGDYRVDVYMDQKLVGTQTFSIYPR